MKHIILFCFLLGTSFANVVSASTIFEQLAAGESSANFQEKTLYTFIQDKDLLATAERVCTQESRKKGVRFGEKLQELLDERYVQMSDAEMLLDSLDLWNRVHAMHGRLSKTIDDEQLCIRKVLMYSLQRHLRKWHIELIEERGLIEDFNSPNPPLREVALKKQIFDELLEQSSSLQTKEFAVRVKNPEFLTTLSTDQRLLAELSRKVMEQALRHVVDLFLKKGWFTSHDVEKIASSIVLEYTNDCGSVAGKYEVTYEVDKNGQHRNVRTTELHLTVSTCTKIGFVLQNFWLAKLIVIHELGHHVWWYKDSDPELFTKLCRLKDDIRNDRCVDRDFVSEYAKVAPEEDYAEHFQQWVIKRRSRPGFIDTKIRYFDSLFK